MKKSNIKQMCIAATMLCLVSYSCNKEDSDANPSPRSDLEGVWVEVPVGRYLRGSAAGLDIERPVDTIKITKAFELSTTEVTNKAFCEFLNAKAIGSEGTMDGTRGGTQVLVGNSANERNGKCPWGVQYVNNQWQPMSGYDYYPVIYVTWFGADEYCKWRSSVDGKTYRLPTEAEWEWAAGWSGLKMPDKSWLDSTFRYAGFDAWGSLGAYAWYNENSGGRSKPVGTKSPNPLGLYDMMGNVNEWCADWFNDKYYQVCSDSASLYAKLEANTSTGQTAGSAYDAAYVEFRANARWLVDPICKDSTIYNRQNTNPNTNYTTGDYYPYKRGARRVFRGGSYVDVQTSGTAGTHRVSYRGHMMPNMVWNSYGFRVLKEK